MSSRKAREARVRTSVGRGRARDCVASLRRFPRQEGEEAAGHGRWLQHEHWHRDPIELDDTGTGKQPFISFYFTNVPEAISYIALRQGFEVCGILEDVYLAKKRNVNGGVFGFVRFGKVLNVEKLLKALNNVWFGDCRVVAKVASFDRFGNRKNDVRVKAEVDNLNGGRNINVVRDNFMGKERGVGAEDAGRGKAKLEVAVDNEGKKEHQRDVRKGLDVVYLRISKVSIYVSSHQGLVRYLGLFDVNYHFKFDR